MAQTLTGVKARFYSCSAYYHSLDSSGTATARLEISLGGQACSGYEQTRDTGIRWTPILSGDIVIACILPSVPVQNRFSSPYFENNCWPETCSGTIIPFLKVTITYYENFYGSSRFGLDSIVFRIASTSIWRLYNPFSVPNTPQLPSPSPSPSPSPPEISTL